MTYERSQTDDLLKIVTSWPALAAIEAAWRDLHGAAGAGLFSSFDWLECQEAAFNRSEPLSVATLWRGDLLVAALPLVASKLPPSKLLKGYRPLTLSLQTCHYSGFQEVMARTDADASSLARAIVRDTGGANIELSMLAPTRASAAFVAELSDAGFHTHREPNFASLLIDGEQDFETYVANRSRNFRKSLRREKAALDKAGIQFERTDPSAPSTLARILDISRRSWKHSSGTGLAAQKVNTDFLSRVLQSPPGTFEPTVGFLRDANGDIAHLTNLRHGHTQYYIWLEFDEKYEALSPGRSILARMLEIDMSDPKVSNIDFIRKTHFTASFADTEYAVDRVRAFKTFGASHLVFRADGLARKLKQGVHKGSRKTVRRADVRSANAPAGTTRASAKS